MLHALFEKKVPESSVLLSSSVVLLQPVQVVENGNVVRRSEFKSFDIAGSLKEFKASDFSISSLESVGALSKLKTTFMSNMSDMNIADKFDNYKIEVNA